MMNQASKPLLLAAFITSIAGSAAAADLAVSVDGIETSDGRIGCALFAGPDGFPMDRATAQGVWIDADPDGVTCLFEDLAPGTYAVSVVHDLNGNQVTDTNFFGIPTEAWGVSNNARPTMRAPRFEEARFDMDGDHTIRIEISD